MFIANSHLRYVLVSLSIGVTSLCAGGIFTFPLLAPSLASRAKLSQAQLTALIVAGMIGQYPFSPVVGRVLDIYGPSTCSMMAGSAFAAGYLANAKIISEAAVQTNRNVFTFYFLIFSFVLTGLGTVFSFFGSIFAASATFPNHPALASGFSMALFGLSPMLLSSVAVRFFSDPNSELLDVVSYLKFLTCLTVLAQLSGAYILHRCSSTQAASDEGGSPHSPNLHSERSHLLSSDPPVTSDPHNSQREYPSPLRDRYFWLLGLYCLLTLGSCEMVISNIGTIVLSLPPASKSNVNLVAVKTELAVSRQIQILSFSNTVSRIIVGLLADFVSPVASHFEPGLVIYPRKRRISRVVFLAGPAFILASAFFWTVAGVYERDAIWSLSAGIGITYGIVFTVIPSIVSSVWGLANLGRNFGIISYAPFIGTPLFSFLYASLSQPVSPGQICAGRICWETTFWVCFATSCIAIIACLVLWKQWRSHV